MSKVFWTDLERVQITQRAADLQSSGLTGLALLRESIKGLPEDRQRHVIALSQAPWFTRMVAEEVGRRIQSQLEAVSVREWQRHMKDSVASMVILLKDMLGELQILNSRVGHSAPFLSEEEESRNTARRPKGS